MTPPAVKSSPWRFFPEAVWFGLRVPSAPDPYGNLRTGVKNINVPSDPFVKATVGMDYTFTKWLYVNAMYVRGFFDEFNDMYGLHNYVVLATDMKFLSDALQLRLSAMLDCNDLSSVAYGQINWIVVPSVELTLGGLVFGGSTNPTDPLDYATKSKFGQKATGRDVVFLKTKITW